MTATFSEDLRIKNLYPIKLLLFLQAAGKLFFLFWQAYFMLQYFVFNLNFFDF